jgi:hypothetical protein
MKKYSIRQAVLNAIDETDDSIGRHMNTLLKWAKYCETCIGTLNGYPVRAELFTVHAAKITLPDSCYKVLCLIPGDYTSEVNLRFKDLNNIVINVDNRDGEFASTPSLEFVWSDTSWPRVPSMLWEEVGNELSIVDQYNDETVTLVYQYIQVDSRGYWLVNESHLEAIKKYLIYQVARKFLNNSFKSSKLTRAIDFQVVQEYKKDYSIAIRNARALDNEENPVDSLNKK